MIGQSLHFSFRLFPIYCISLGSRKLRTLDKLADDIDMTVVDMGVGDHMQQLAGNHIDRLRNHH